MKKPLVLLALSVSVLAGPISLSAYDAEPAFAKIVPECVWAAATGGGTWKTEVQVTNMSAAPTTVMCVFLYGTGHRGPFVLATALPYRNSLRYDNILATMDSLDPDASFSYFGRVGAVAIGYGERVLVTAKTVNGNYGKSFPGLNVVAGNTAALGRPMVIQGLVNNSTYRTFAGFLNTSSGNTRTVRFSIYSAANTLIGSPITRALLPVEYIAFNPFVEAGVGAGSYNNCWLYIEATDGDSTVYGIMGFGAIANNTTNDPTALLAYPAVTE